MRLTPTYLDGAIVAANAIRGTRLLIDAHRCVMERCWARDNTHDWRGRLSGTGPYTRDRRVFAPNWSGYLMATGTEERFADYLRLIASRYPGEPILVVRGQMSLLTNTDVQGVALEVGEELGAPILCVEREGFDDDWIDGIRSTFEAVWKHKARSPQGDPGPFAAGFCLFRHEGDEEGNVIELRRLFTACEIGDLQWPLAGTQGDFGGIEEKAPRLLFPFLLPDSVVGRASVTARVSLPIGIERTSAMLREAGNLFGREQAVDRVIASACDLLEKELLPFVSRVLAGRGALVIADPWTADGLCRAVRELGMDVPLAVALRRHDRDDVAASLLTQATKTAFDPQYAQVEHWLKDLVARREVDVVIGSGMIHDAAARAGIPYVEVTAPHYLEHFALPTPYMGYEGMLRLAERLANAIATSRYRRGF